MQTIPYSVPRKVLVTGARGFVGRPVVAALLACGSEVRGAVRSEPAVAGEGIAARYQEIAAGELGPHTDWRAALAGVEVVVHLAARVHQMNDRSADPLTEFRRVNVEGTRRLAEQAASAGVRRLVFVSSIKVNGEGTEGAAAYTENDIPAPADPYGVSKLEAEQALQAVGAATGLEVVVLRPPLMVGKGVKGNLAALAGAIRRGRPLPFGSITGNRRSLLDVRNLADAIVLCAAHPKAAGEVFLVSDGVPVSTVELTRHLGRVAGRSPVLIPVPVSLLRLAGRLTGKSSAVERLIGSLLIDDSKMRSLLGWKSTYGPVSWEV